MNQINKRLELGNIKTNENLFLYKTPESYTSKTFNNNILYDNKYRKELIMAKIIISELQDSIEIIKKEKKELESKLEDTINTLKNLHIDYITLTQRFDEVNQKMISDLNNKELNYENKIKELKLKNEELLEELSTKKEINKIQEEALEKQNSLLKKKLEKTEEELNSTKKMVKFSNNIEKNNNIINKENIELREDNIKMSEKFNKEYKKMSDELEKYKNIVKKLENENFLINKELNENKIKLEKEQKINMQKNKMDKYLNNTMDTKNDKYEILSKKYEILLKEKNELDKLYQQIKNKNKNYIYL